MTTNVYDFLDTHDIPYTSHKHEAVFTVEEANKLYDAIPGAHTKNLFLRNHNKSQYYLFIIASHKRADLKQLAELLGEKKLHFGNPEELMQYLQLTPGSVSALGLINDTEHNVRALVDTEVWESHLINAHPNINTATLTFTKDAFHTLFSILNRTPILVDAT